MRKNKNEKGFTIIELLVGASIAVISVIGFAIALSESQKGFNESYNRVYSDVVTGSHIAQRTFDSIVRKSTTQWLLVDNNGEWVEVYYYSDPNAIMIDSYARFYQSDTNLCVEYGNRSPREVLSVSTICSNVTSCEFQNTGKAVQMILMLDKGDQHITATTSAMLHN